MRPELLAHWNELGAISEKRKRENAGFDFVLDWGHCPLPELMEVRARRREKLRELLKELETFWNETAPASEGFTVEKAIELLLYEVKRG